MLDNAKVVKQGGGEEVYLGENSLYVKNTIVHNFIWSSSRTLGQYRGCVNMESFFCDANKRLGGNGYSAHGLLEGCTSLKSIEFPQILMVGDGWCDVCFGNCPNLKTAIFGSIGHPLTEFYYTSYARTPFEGDTQNDLTITIYVDASTLADIPIKITKYAPWGATHATIVYRSATTGEVIEI